jgi:hypothetical protein
LEDYRAPFGAALNPKRRSAAARISNTRRCCSLRRPKIDPDQTLATGWKAKT